MKFIAILIILCIFTGVGSAQIYETSGSGQTTSSGAGYYWKYLDNAPHSQNYVFYGYGSIEYITPSNKYVSYHVGVYDAAKGFKSVSSGSIRANEGRYSASGGGSYSGAGLTDDGSGHEARFQRYVASTGTSYKYNWKMTIITGQNYTIYGDVGCVNNITMHYQNDSIWHEVITQDVSGDTSYSYDIIDNMTYKIAFDAHVYEFEVNGSDINYNYNNCIYTAYQFKDRCGNLIKDSEGFYIEKIGTTAIVAENFYAPSGELQILSSASTSIYISTNTFAGNAGFNIDPVLNDTTYNCTNAGIAWWLRVEVIDDNTSLPLPSAHVSINQSCYATSGVFTSHKNTDVNGVVSYDGMSLSNAALHVTKDGYKFLDDNSTGFHATLSGRAGFSGKTWIIRLAPSDSENESSWSEVNGSTYIYFKDIAGNITTRISDSDANVYLYYENNNSDEEPMTLKFQSSSTHTYFSDELSWTIPHDEAGYKTIANSYFTPASYSYRAILYNSTIYGWNITKPLSVLTGAQETIYGNLTTALWFSRASGGKIDFREDMKIVSHACSNNTTLMNVDVELWKDGVYLAHTNLTATDFLTASFKYYDTWNPVFDYVSGSNYSIRMYGFDRTLLETDYVECYTDTVTRRNKLTIMVKSQSGGNLRNSFVFLEGWGQLETGSNYYNSYEGLENGTYRYKASKSGYDGAGWDEIVIADGDETVTYVLTSQTSAASHASAKMSDSDVKEIFFPCMFALLIFIVLGGFKYVLK